MQPTVRARITTAAADVPRPLWILGALAFINLLGLSFIWPVTTIYIHNVLGRPVTVAGLVLMLYSGASVLGQFTGGLLFDRIGARPVIVTGLLLAAAFIALPGLVESWPLYVAAMPLYGFAESLVFPAVNALAAASWPGGGRKPFNFLYVAQNAGVAAGTAVVGLVAGYSFRLVFLGAGALALSAGILALILVRQETGASAGSTAWAAAAGPAPSVPWLPVILLLLSNFSLWVIYMQWSSTLAVYIEGVGIPLAAYSLLWTLNGLIIVFGQPLLALLVRSVRSLISQLYVGTGLYMAAFALLLLPPHYAVFVVSMAVLTFGEMLLWPAVPAAVDQVAPPERRGFLQGAVGGATALGRMVGPLAGGLIYDHFGTDVLLFALPLLLFVPLGFIALYSRTAPG